MNTSRGPLADPLALLTVYRGSALDADSAGASDATPHPAGRDHRPGRDSSTRRVSHRQLVELAERLSQRDRLLLHAVGEFRLLRGDQIRRLFFTEISTEGARARVCRRSLQALVAAKLLHRLERRVGGARAGSSGWVYALTPVSRRLLVYWQGKGFASDRGVHEPGHLFTTHTLAVAELYVRLLDAHRESLIELLAFEAEPVRPYFTPHGRTLKLKPDALVRLVRGDYEYACFCELDLATEGRGALLRKCRAYIDYYRLGREQAEHGLFPIVVWLAINPERAAYIAELIGDLPPAARRLFATGTTDDPLAALTGAALTPGGTES